MLSHAVKITLAIKVCARTKVITLDRCDQISCLINKPVLLAVRCFAVRYLLNSSFTIITAQLTQLHPPHKEFMSLSNSTSNTVKSEEMRRVSMGSYTIINGRMPVYTNNDVRNGNTER